MLVDYSVTDMGCFYDYSDAATCSKTIRGNGITTFIFHVAQCITLLQTKIVTETLITKALLKPLYSRLGFKVIKDFSTSPHFKEARKRFNYEPGKYKALQEKTIGLQYHPTIPRSVTIFHVNQIDFIYNINVFKYLN